jgi:hypothetical protein
MLAQWVGWAVLEYIGHLPAAVERAWKISQFLALAATNGIP